MNSYVYDLVSLSRNPVHSHHRREANEITPKRCIVRYCGMKILKGSISVKAIDSVLNYILIIYIREYRMQ